MTTEELRIGSSSSLELKHVFDFLSSLYVDYSNLIVEKKNKRKKLITE
jgi:hypothetical protein